MHSAILQLISVGLPVNLALRAKSTALRSSENRTTREALDRTTIELLQSRARRLENKQTPKSQ